MSSVFRLDPSFVSSYANKTAPFGFGGLGEFVYLRTYSRIKPDGGKERWFETVERVVNGIYTMQKRHIETHSLGWKEVKGQRSASEMYDRIFHMKFLPPGRGLFCAGAPVTEERGIYAALNNCAFVSTIDLAKDLSKPFVFLMDMSMLGVGVGFDCKGEGSIVIQEPDEMGAQVFVIPDSREGWVEALRRLIDSYFVPESVVQRFDYSLVRPAGLLIKGFGGTSSGPEPLRDLLERVRVILGLEVGKGISLTSIVDICNLIGRCVVAGNVRRCLPGDTLVHMKNGLIPIKDVKVGEEVLTVDGYKKVIDHVVQGVQKLVKIVTQDGEFRCTPTHRMAVLTDIKGNYEWKVASELEEGDRLMSSRVAIPGVVTKLPDWVPVCNSARAANLVIPEFDPPMAWLMGVFHGDGYTNFSNDDNSASHITITFGLHEDKMAIKAQQQLQRFGSDLVVSRTVKNGENAIRVVCNSKELATYFGLNIKRAKTPIQVPKWIFESTIENRQAYIAGVCDSDGCTTNRPLSVVCTIYPNWAKQIQALFYSLGIESRILIDKVLYEKKKLLWQPQSFVSLINTRSVVSFSEFPELMKEVEVKSRSQNANGFPTSWARGLGSTVVKKYGLTNPKLKQFNIDSFTKSVGEIDFCPCEVKSVVDDVEEETYDLTVADNHCFYAQGLSVHNTAEISFGDYRSKEFINLKNYELNPQRQEYGWASNNSVLGDVGMDYKDIVPGIIANGEPGIVWLDNMRAYSRMNGTADYKDHKVMGSNPCLTIDTVIHTDKGLMTIKDLIGQQFNAVVDGKVYSSTDKGFWMTAQSQPVLKVQLDNGLFVRCTANHQILMRNGEWCEAGSLKVGADVKLSNNRGYEDATRAMIVSILDANGSLRNEDINRLETTQRLLFSLGIVSNLNKEAHELTLLEDSSKYYSSVLSITPDGVEDVYDATVPSVSRFTANGVIVHNCSEQSLEPYELCTLCETMPFNHATLQDYKRTLKFAYLYAKTVTLGKTHWPETNRVLLRNRRIGCSMTGIAQFISKRGIETFREWCQEGYEIIDHYDKIYSNWLCVNPAIKRTSIKPSGSVSLLSGSTPGMHYPESRFYIRRVRLADDSDMIPGLLQAGYHVEKDTYSPDTSVVSFAVDCGEGVRVQKDVPMWEQLSLAAFLQEHWADNQVSCTITFDPVTEGPQIASALDYFQYKLKGISFLPRVKAGAYKQMPYEAITEEEYLKMASGLKELKLSDKADAVSERFCDGESCAMVMPKK
ncbi:MAG: hypothetical protein WC208_16595 [Gallionella sp.]|jgi:intein/homing endonuclease